MVYKHIEAYLKTRFFKNSLCVLRMELAVNMGSVFKMFIFVILLAFGFALILHAEESPITEDSPMAVVSSCDYRCSGENYSEHPHLFKLDTLCRTVLRLSYDSYLSQTDGGHESYEASEAWIDCQEKLLNLSAIAYSSNLPKEKSGIFLGLHAQWKKLRDFTCTDMTEFWAEKLGYAGTGLILTIGNCIAIKNHLRIVDLELSE